MIREYLAERDAVQVAIFGSYARGGEAGPDSDIDVLVEFGAKKSLFDIVEYELALGELVGKKIDLVTKPSLSQKGQAGQDEDCADHGCGWFFMVSSTPMIEFPSPPMV